MEDQKYTVVINGKPQGPYRLEQLKELSVKPGTFVKTSGMDDYKEAHEFPELRALLGFAHLATLPQYFASFDQRLLSSAIDYFILFLLYIFLLLLSFIFVEEKEQRIMLFVSFLPLLPIGKFVYGSIAEASAKQGSIGKRLLAIKVTDLEGKRITLAHSFGRNAAKILSVMSCFIGYLYSFLNKKQQCWHDVIANTLVIKDRLI